MSKALIDVVWVPCDPDRPAELKQVGQGTLADYQALVGGPIDLVPLADTGRCDPDSSPCQCSGALFNEEGLGTLPPNERANRCLESLGLTNGGYGYFGDAVFVGLPPGQEFGPATPEMIAYWLPGDTGAALDGDHGPTAHDVITYEVPGGHGQAGR